MNGKDWAAFFYKIENKQGLILLVYMYALKNQARN